MMVALALGGCTPEQDLAQCEVEAFRLYPNHQYGIDSTNYMRTCMRAKGYEFTGGGEANPRNYKPTGWRAQFLAPSSWSWPFRPHER
jgi:hypothetical protein